MHWTAPGYYTLRPPTTRVTVNGTIQPVSTSSPANSKNNTKQRKRERTARFVTIQLKHRCSSLSLNSIQQSAVMSLYSGGQHLPLYFSFKFLKKKGIEKWCRQGIYLTVCWRDWEEKGVIWMPSCVYGGRARRDKKEEKIPKMKDENERGPPVWWATQYYLK
jgi:hypothetical protein